MTDPRTRQFWLAQFNRIKGLREEDGAEALAQLGHPLAPGPSRVRLGRRRLVPAVLHRGLTDVNRLRQAAAAAIHQRSARTAPVPLAPATAWRKHRGRATSAFPSTYPTARGVLHAPAWCLPRLDELGAQALMTWSLTMLGTHSAAQSAAADEWTAFETLYSHYIQYRKDALRMKADASWTPDLTANAFGRLLTQHGFPSQRQGGVRGRTGLIAIGPVL